ncbi:MAG: hypothetical protein K2K00_03080 [Muribaculaceae bacterium]|nr:hypothetical protein [Muribaculaceae bacterium]
MSLKSIIIAISVSAVALSGHSKEIYNTRPVDISPGIISVDTLPTFFSDCHYHLRIEIPRRCSNPKWSVTLQYADSTYSTIEFLRPGSAIADIDYGLPLDIIASDFTPDAQCVSTQQWHLVKDIDPTVEGWSLTITCLPDDNELICSVGQRNPLISIPVKSEGLYRITASSQSAVRLSRLSLFTTETDNLSSVCVSSLDELSERLSQPDTSIEGYWRYLDRDTDPRRLNTGGNYRLATVKSPDGSVEIIYLGGAARNDAKWQPLMLKGRLIPNAFINHYDLIWYDAFGAKIDMETSADLIDGAILKLNFPLHGGTIRFQKDTVRTAQPVNR